MSDNVYRQMFHNMNSPGVIHEIVTDPQDGSTEYLFVEVNPAFEKVTGFNNNQLVGKRVQDVFPEFEIDWTCAQGTATISDKAGYFMSSSHDVKSCFEISSFSVGPQKVALVMDDVSSFKKKEQQLLVEKNQMEELSNLKAHFFAEMSHELRAPLNGIVGMANLLVQEKMGDDAAMMAETLLRSSQKLMVLINNLLDCSKLESEMMTLAYEWVNIADHLTELMEETKILAQGKAINLVLFVDPSFPKVIHTDPMRLVQIITNLISNAIKFTEKGTVHLICEAVEGPSGKSLLKFHVRDTGVGICPEKLDCIFNRFTQLHCETSKKQPGSGLGLDISRKLAQLMGGMIRVSSSQGKGSTFTLELPCEGEKTFRELPPM